MTSLISALSLPPPLGSPIEGAGGGGGVRKAEVLNVLPTRQLPIITHQETLILS